MSLGWTDTRRNTLRSQYTWPYVISSVKSRAARLYVSGNALCDIHGTPNEIALCAKHTNPPSAPPFYDI